MTTSFMKILNFFLKIYEILKFYEIFEILNFFEIFEIFYFFFNFWVFVNRRSSPSVPNKYKTFIQSGRGTKNPRKRFTLPVHSLICLLTGYEGIASLLSLRHWLLTEVKPRSIVRVEGTTNLLFPNTVYKYFIMPKIIRLIVEWSPQNDKDQ